MDRSHAWRAGAAAVDQQLGAHLGSGAADRGIAAAFVLFSEFTGRGFQMSIAASTESRAGQRTVYLPAAEAGMAHRSALSPDRTQVLVVEMDAGGWLPCRVIPFDGSTPGRPIGPTPSQCTDAAWTPDGQWMYFSASTATGTHIWRQRFPRGLPEQVTFGVTEEEDIHVDPDGRSFVTAIGNRQSTVWIHDASGNRQITSEGFAFLPAFSPDGRTLYYLTRSGTTRRAFTGGLTAADLGSGQRQRLLPEFQMVHYDISADGQRVVFVAADDSGGTSVWLAPVNGRTAPRRIAARNSWKAFFAPPGAVVFAGEESPGSFRLYRIGEDGNDLRAIGTTPMLDPFAVSPDGRWVAAAEGPSPETRNALMVHPVAGGTPVLVCRCYPPPNIESGPMPAQLRWTPDASVLYLRYNTSTYAIPLPAGEMLPPIPPAGFASKDAVAALPGARLIAEESVFTGPSPSVHAFMKVSTQRNIYRVPIP